MTKAQARDLIRALIMDEVSFHVEKRTTDEWAITIQGNYDVTQLSAHAGVIGVTCQVSGATFL